MTQLKKSIGHHPALTELSTDMVTDDSITEPEEIVTFKDNPNDSHLVLIH